MPIKVGADSWLPLGQTCWFFTSEISQTHCRPGQTIFNNPRIQFTCLRAGGNHDAFILELAWLLMLLIVGALGWYVGGRQSILACFVPCFSS
jgi:hypothetical protein